MEARSRRRIAGGRATLWALVVSTAVVLSGCSSLLGLDAGEREADRLGKVVEGLPGVESVEASGTTTVSYPSTTSTEVTMSADATPEQRGAVLLGWSDAAGPGSEHPTMSKSLSVAFRNEQCRAWASGEAPPEQLADTAVFLPALCAAFPTADISASDGGEGRVVSIRFPHGRPAEPVDVDRLRELPGALTGRDHWRVGGTEYRWGDSE